MESELKETQKLLANEQSLKKKKKLLGY